MPIPLDAIFSPDYFVARERFREAARQIGWSLASYAIRAAGPGGEELTIDAAIHAPAADSAAALVVSSGLHGVEGFFGSAVQLAMFARWRSGAASIPPARIVLLHGLNPYGFAWRRRWNEDNVDPNRNFLPPGSAPAGCSEAYRELNRLLNPQRPPSRWEPFLAKAALAIGRHGFPALKQAIAGGQDAFPQGLFFTGREPIQTRRIIEQHWDAWLGDAKQVVHLDYHTGLGSWATHKLLVGYDLGKEQRQRMERRFRPSVIEVNDPAGTAYQTSGDIGRWLVERQPQRDYFYACAEFGTYRPLKVLRGLRAENQAHHWCAVDDPRREATKQQLVELFCPADRGWRQRAVAEACRLIEAT